MTFKINFIATRFSLKRQLTSAGCTLSYISNWLWFETSFAKWMDMFVCCRAVTMRCFKSCPLRWATDGLEEGHSRV